MEEKIAQLEQEVLLARAERTLHSSKADMHYAEMKRLLELNKQFKEILKEFTLFFKSRNSVPVSRAAIDTNSRAVQKLFEVLKIKDE